MGRRMRNFKIDKVFIEVKSMTGLAMFFEGNRRHGFAVGGGLVAVSTGKFSGRVSAWNLTTHVSGVIELELTLIDSLGELGMNLKGVDLMTVSTRLRCLKSMALRTSVLGVTTHARRFGL